MQVISNNIRKVGRREASILIVAALAVLLLGARTLIRDLYEDASFALAPSAARAYLYGERHFNARNPHEYDIARAANFFYEAEKLDPSLLYVHHELARVYFLRGDFGDALMQIDTQIAEHGDKTPNSYYVRGLIEGYMGDYADSAKDYEHFLKFDPHDWAGINDYAWVLLKAERAKDAEAATAEGLKYFPSNPWLLNTNAIALYESGRMKKALAPAQAAVAAGAKLTEAEWLHAYPGNDPQIAGAGIAAFRAAAQANVHMIEQALASSTLQ